LGERIEVKGDVIPDRFLAVSRKVPGVIPLCGCHFVQYILVRFHVFIFLICPILEVIAREIPTFVAGGQAFLIYTALKDKAIRGPVVRAGAQAAFAVGPGVH
jgi:hypothetical protein